MVITGGAGFIGSEFVRQIAKDWPNPFLVLDSLTYAGNIVNIASSIPQNSFKKVDINSSLELDQTIKEFLSAHEKKDWTIINFAAESHVDRSISNSKPFIDTNISGTTNLLDVAVKYHATKFFQISTDEIYGPCTESTGFSESSPYNPSSPYAVSKAAAEMMALSYQRTHNLNVVITRASNNFGPYQTPEKLIPRLIMRGISGLSLPIYGDGTQIREWSFVEDHVRNLITLLKNVSGSKIYNIGSHSRIQNIEIARKICSILNLPERKIEFVKDRKGHDKRYALNSNKFMNDFEFSEGMFEENLVKTVEWYSSNLISWPPLNLEAFKKLEMQYEIS